MVNDAIGVVLSHACGRSARQSTPSCATQEIYPGDSREQASVWRSASRGICEGPWCSGIPNRNMGPRRGALGITDEKDIPSDLRFSGR